MQDAFGWPLPIAYQGVLYVRTCTNVPSRQTLIRTGLNHRNSTQQKYEQQQQQQQQQYPQVGLVSLNQSSLVSPAALQIIIASQKRRVEFVGRYVRTNAQLKKLDGRGLYLSYMESCYNFSRQQEETTTSKESSKQDCFERFIGCFELLLLLYYSLSELKMNTHTQLVRKREPLNIAITRRLYTDVQLVSKTSITQQSFKLLSTCSAGEWNCKKNNYTFFLIPSLCYHLYRTGVRVYTYSHFKHCVCSICVCVCVCVFQQ